MAGGRPTKFTTEVIEKARDYIHGGYEEEGDSIPSHVGIAFLLNITRSTLYKWAEENKEGFSDILESCNQKQHQLLIGKGLSGDFNASIAKLVLGKHGYHDRQEHTGPDGGAVKVESKTVTLDMASDEAVAIYRDLISGN